MSGLATGGRHSALFLRAVLACASLLVVDHADVHAQASIGNLLNPVQDGFANPQDLPGQQLSQADQSPPPGQQGPAPSRIGQTPTYGTPAASGASDDGYDPLNRKRKKPKPYPGAPKLKGSIGPGNRDDVPSPPVRPTTLGSMLLMTVQTGNACSERSFFMPSLTGAIAEARAGSSLPIR